MKTIWRGIPSITVIVVALFAVGLVIQAQTDNPLQPVALTNAPQGAAFFKMSDYIANGGSLGGPYPFMPDTNAPLYSLCGSTFLVDDAVITNDDELANALSLLAQPQDAFSSNLLSGNTVAGRAMTMDDVDINPGDYTNSPDGGDGGTNSYTPGVVTYPTNVLWLEILPLGTNEFNADPAAVTLILHNTEPNQTYEFISREILTDTVWHSEGFVLGARGTNFTTRAVVMGARTNLFFSARSWVDSEQVGIPDWWQLKYFGVVGIDPNADPDNDGMSNLQEFENGTDPTVFNIPVAPSDFMAILAANGTNVMVSWQASLVAVQYYTLGRYTFNWDTFHYDYTSLGQITNNVTSFRDVGAITNGESWATYYQLQATYATGSTPTERADISSDIPVPQGFAVSFNPSTEVATLSWLPSPGPVTGYTVLRQDTATSGFSAIATVSATTYEDDPVPSGGDVEYEVEANYDDGNSPPTDPKNPRTQGNYTVSGSIVRGAQGKIYLLVPAIPEGVTNVRVYRTDTHQSYYPVSTFKPLGTGMASVYSLLPSELFSPGADGYFDISVSAFTNGIYQLSTNQVPLYGTYRFQVQGRGSNGQFGDKVDTGYVTGDPGRPDYVIPFFDGRANIAQNITFLLRASQTNFPFFTSSEDYDYQPGASWGYSGHFDYVYAGFHFFDYTRTNDFTLNEFQPFEENHYYLNYCYEGTNVNINTDGFLNTGAYSPGGTIDSHGDDIWYYETVAYWTTSGHPPTSYFFDTVGLVSGTSSPSLSPVLSSDATRWILFLNGPFDVYNTNYYIPAMNNVYGLPLQTFKWPGPNTTPYSFQTANIGDLTDLSSSGDWFREFGQPTLATNSYYFAQQNIDPLPGESAFSITNSTRPLFIASVGKPFSITAWAKQSLQNGYSGVFAYPEQYIDKAYKADTNGNPTTTETGILSEYGEFFPTESGEVILTTKPDATTGTTAQCAVNVLKMQLDVNHDGTMDASFAGPDNTSQAHPFEFWINNDNDVSDTDDDPGHELAPPSIEFPDYATENINSQRDLEDYARMWFCGIPALPLSDGYQVTLSWNVTSGSPTINLVQAVETNGGTLYLTDTNTAALQASGHTSASPSYKFATISPTNSYTFPASYFASGGNKYFLFEGAGVGGSGELVLTISQGTSILGRASAWIDLRDVKGLYERVTIQDASDDPPSDTVSTYQIQNQISETAAKQTAVFVHGWRMGMADYYSFSESMFKRLYWQGFAGKFVSVRWPTLSKDDFLLPLLDLFTYNHSEFRSFESGRGLASYLTDLRGRFPDDTISVASHSMGGIVTMRALKWHLTNGRQDINNYVLMQTAVPAHCYDTNLPDYTPFVAAEASSPTPDAYRGYPGSIDEAVRGNLVNFYNTNDYALATGTFGPKAVSWEQNEISYKPDAGYASDGTIGYTANYNVTDVRELMSLVARPRSKAVGALPGVAGVIQGGEVDLTSLNDFLGDKSEHSAEFNWNVQKLGPFYNTLLNNLFPPQ